MRPGRTGAAVLMRLMRLVRPLALPARRWSPLSYALPLLPQLLLLLPLLLAHGGARAAPCVAPPPDPANTYDAPHTYAKLQRGYPFIRIADTAPPADVRVIAGQTYVQYGTRCLMLDLYLPTVSASAADGGKPAPALPVVVLVHGGGWRYGDRSEFAAMAIRLAQRGYAAAAVSYRLSGEAPYPAAIHDVRAAVRWVRANAAAYGFDPGRVALAGGSAGGQIASLAGVTGDPGQFDPGAASNPAPGPASSLASNAADSATRSPAAQPISSAVQAIVNIDGLSDFTSEAARRYEDDPNKQPSSAGAWFGGRYAEKTALWREASPIQYVRAGMPPILFIGSAQPRFSVGRDEMAARMAAAGATSRTVILPDTPHSFWMFDPWLQPTVDATLAFLNQHMPPR